MLNKLKPKSEFSRNVLTLMTGTTIAQAIPIAISPILTRIYTPEDFGLFALYMGIVSIISVVSTGRYELAIMLPKKDENAFNIVILSVLISVFVSFLFLFIVIIFNSEITNLLKNTEISNWLYLVPISILCTGIYQSSNYWVNRKKQYKKLSFNKVLQSGTTASTNLIIRFVTLGPAGLILGNIFGILLSTFFLSKSIYMEDNSLFKKIKKIKIYLLAKKYIDFLKYDTIAILVNVSAQQLPNIFFNLFFSVSIAGNYYLTQRILQVPIIFISRAILDVFKEEASSEYNKYGNCKKIYLITLKKLILIGIVPTIILYNYSVDFFVLIFGESWKIAGEYTKIMTPMLYMRFISYPLSFMFYIGKKQKLNLISQILLFIMIILSFALSSNSVVIIKLISTSFSIFYIYQICVSAHIAKVYTRRVK